MNYFLLWATCLDRLEGKTAGKIYSRWIRETDINVGYVVSEVIVYAVYYGPAVVAVVVLLWKV